MSLNQLKVKDIEKISIKIYENACELIEEAELLYAHGKFARAHACAQFSIEEFGKLPMLYTTALQVSRGDKINWKSLNKRLRNHESKTSLSFALIGVIGKQIAETVDLEKVDIYSLLPDNLEEYKDFLDKDFNIDPSFLMENFDKPLEELKFDFIVRQAIASVLNKYKNLSLYADYNEKEFVKPSEIITERRCKDRIKAALLEKKLIDVFNNKNYSFSKEDHESFESLVSHFKKKIYEN